MVVGGASVDGRFRHSQKLEELRNIQEHISHERALWTKEKDAQEKWIADKRRENQEKQVSLFFYICIFLDLVYIIEIFIIHCMHLTILTIYHHSVRV